MSSQENRINPDSQMPADHQFDLLVYAYLEGVINSADAAILQEYLRDPRYVRYFVRRCKQEQAMYDLVSSNFQQQAEAYCSFESGVWQELARYEDSAPTVQCEKTAEAVILQETVPQPAVRTINKTSLVVALTGIAALAFLVLYLHFNPIPVEQEVATLSDTMNVKWAEGTLQINQGYRFSSPHDSLQLLGGVVKIQYDQGVELIVEGPAKFDFISPTEYGLSYGKVYAHVSRDGRGFTVVTPNSRITDLGTEFGVQRNIEGVTDVHVLHGKTSLSSGFDTKKIQFISQGQAKRIVSDTGKITDIDIQMDQFVRQISSAGNLVWRGEPLSLASLVAGGNGFTQGQGASGIDPATGEIRAETVQGQGRSGMNLYREVKDRPLVDGVFVPSGVHGATVVSSAGHTFTFPKTDGYYYSDITPNPYVQRIDSNGNINISLKPEAVDTADPILIFIHTNAGITFNLEKIRQSLPHLEIDRFKSSCGISQGGEEINRSEFWVLIDGQCVFHHSYDKNNRDVRDIDIPIKPEQKFLTLATTDGDDKIVFDWCVFDRPQLLLEKKQDVGKAGSDTEMVK